MTDASLISVVDDDESLRESLEGLLKAVGYTVSVFSSAEGFLASQVPAKTNCLILDVRMPGMSGPELQQKLKTNGHRIPIIFITAQCDQNLRPTLIARGAVECLFKPFNEQELRSALDCALRKPRAPTA